MIWQGTISTLFVASCGSADWVPLPAGWPVLSGHQEGTHGHQDQQQHLHSTAPLRLRNLQQLLSKKNYIFRAGNAAASTWPCFQDNICLLYLLRCRCREAKQLSLAQLCKFPLFPNTIHWNGKAKANGPDAWRLVTKRDSGSRNKEALYV